MFLLGEISMYVYNPKKVCLGRRDIKLHIPMKVQKRMKPSIFFPSKHLLIIYKVLSTSVRL